MKQVLIVVAAVVVAVALSQLLFEFYDWNRQQSCATSGGRGCGGASMKLNH
jgi:hypothetical protein